MAVNLKLMIPELSNENMKGLVVSNVSLTSLIPDEYRALVKLVIAKLENFYNFKYCLTGDLEGKASLTMIWMGGLCDLSVRSLFGGLIACLNGKTKYIDTSPPNVVAFHHICKMSEFPSSYFSVPLPVLLEAPICSDTVKNFEGYNKHMRLIKDMVKTTNSMKALQFKRTNLGSVVVKKDDIMTTPYAVTKMEELGLTPEEVRGESDPDFTLDVDDLKHIRSDRKVFDAWVEHIYTHKRMRKLGIGPYEKLKVGGTGDDGK